jgi:glycosyltransferase involved in cell wall biosynthesis
MTYRGSDGRVRVAHVTTVDMSMYYLLVNQLLEIRQAGYEVAGIASPGPFVSAITRAGLEFLPVPMTRRLVSPLVDLQALYRLYRVMRHRRFDIVHTHNPKPGLLGQLAARLAGVPIVANTIHGYYFHERQPAIIRSLYVAVERLAARLSDVIFFQNEEDLAAARREGIGQSERLRYLGNGINLSRFDPSTVSPERTAALRATLGLPDGAPIVGFVGRLVREKGILDFLTALRMVRDAVPGVRALIVGPVDVDKADAVTPEAAVRAGVAEACVFTGARDDLPDLYALMNVLVLPSYREGFPRAPMEASAMSVPCVVTDIRGCRQVVDHGFNGLRVPVGDTSALALAILTILRDPATAAVMGAEGRRIAQERFDEQAVFTRIISEYVRLLRAKGMPVPSPSAQHASARP